MIGKSQHRFSFPADPVVSLLLGALSAETQSTRVEANVRLSSIRAEGGRISGPQIRPQRQRIVRLARTRTGAARLERITRANLGKIGRLEDEFQEIWAAIESVTASSS